MVAPRPPRTAKHRPAQNAAGRGAANTAVASAPTPGARAARLVLLCTLVIQLSWMLNVYPHWKETNSASRVYLTQAIVEQGTLRIDACLKKYGDTLDKAHYAGHYYSDKAPGTSFWFLPVAWALHAAGMKNMLAFYYALRLLCISLPVVAFWRFTLAWFADWAGSQRRGVAVVAAGAIGTNYLIYATQLYSHVPAGCWLFLAFLSVRRVWSKQPTEVSRTSNGETRAPADSLYSGPAFLAGALGGFAFLNDFIVMPAVAVLGAASCFPWFRWRQPLNFALGLAPWLALWMTYNWICFDHPLRTGFYYHAAQIYGDAYRSGFLGIQGFDQSALLGMLFSPARGMLFLSPVLALAPWGAWRMIRSGRDRGDAICASLAVLGLFLFAMTTVDWRGGWSIGVRYLTPAVPFLLVGVAGALRGVKATDPVSIVFGGLATVGILLCTLATATVPMFAQEFDNPLYALDLPLLLEGNVGPNLGGSVLGILILALAAMTTVGLALLGGFESNHSTASTTGEASLAAVVNVPAGVGVTIASLILAGIWMVAQSQLRPGSVDARAQAAARCEALVRLGQFEQAEREGLKLADVPGASDSSTAATQSPGVLP